MQIKKITALFMMLAAVASTAFLAVCAWRHIATAETGGENGV